MMAAKMVRGLPRGGFTLIEVLIVIGIIALLAGLSFAGIRVAIRNANVAAAEVTLAGLNIALDNDAQDEGTYPAAALEPDPERND